MPKYKGVEYQIKNKTEVTINNKEVTIVEQGGKYSSPEYAFMVFDDVEELVKKIIDNNPNFGKSDT